MHFWFRGLLSPFAKRTGASVAICVTLQSHVSTGLE